MRDRQGPGGTSSDFTLACLEPCCTLRQVGPQSPYLCGLSRVPDLAGRGLALGPFRPIIHLQSDSLPLVLPRHKFWVAGRALQQPQGSGVQYGPHIKRVLATGPSGWMHKYLPTVGPKASSLAGLSSPLGPAQDLCLPPPPREGASQGAASLSASCGTSVLSREVGHLVPSMSPQLPLEALGTWPLCHRPERGQHSLQ